MAHKIKAEIFKEGTWHPSNSEEPLTFTGEDLKDMVAGFEAMKSEFGIPLKLGHDDSQPLTDGLPAIGWVDKLWIEGKKLMAEFRDVPEIVYKAITNQLYRTVSVELDETVEFEGRSFSWILAAVSLLGAELPAVSGLAGLNAYLSKNRSAEGGTFAFKAKNFTIPKPSEKKTMSGENEGVTREEFNKLFKTVTDQTVELTKAQAENKTLKEEKAEQEKTLLTAKVEDKRKEVTAILDEAVKEKRILPAQREAFAKAIGLEEDRVSEVELDQVKAFAKSTDPKKDDEEQGQGDSGETEEAPDILFKKSRERQLEMGKAGSPVSFNVAMESVMIDNPELARAWVDQTGV